jgi:hypothetical protein
MKMLRNVLHHNDLLSTSVAATLTIILAVTFWFAFSPKASAVTCTVCHKRTQTITGLDCGGLDYQRHIDHGDTNGACVTPTGNQ